MPWRGHVSVLGLGCSCTTPAVQRRSLEFPGRPPPPAHSCACCPGQSRTPRPHHLCSPPDSMTSRLQAVRLFDCKVRTQVKGRAMPGHYLHSPCNHRLGQAPECSSSSVIRRRCKTCQQQCQSLSGGVSEGSPSMNSADSPSEPINCMAAGACK